MADTTTYSNAVVTKLLEAEDIYIDCRPVDTTGEVIELDDDNYFDEVGITSEMFDDASDMLINSDIINNIGFQSALGIILLLLLYTLGDYVFRKFPTSIINKKIETSNYF